MGVDYKGNNIPFIVLVLFLACIGYEFQLSVGCKEQERGALLTFKRGLIDDGGLLSSWGSHDECCEWEGVECSNTTGHVTALRVIASTIMKGDSYHYYSFRGKINSALLQLHHLTSLDLSENNFEGIKIPEFIGSIKSLQHLDLSGSNFSGSIPFHLGNLTNLRTLHISNNFQLQSQNLNWLSRLSFLSVLDLSLTKISDANWVQHVLMLPSLQQLYLLDCMLPDVTKSLFVYNSSSSAKFLSILDLEYNDLTSSTFHWLFNARLSFVTFDFLELLDLSHNKIQGGIPKSLRNLTHLQELNLSYNGLGEALEELLGKLPRTKMVTLHLSNNKLTGSVPTFLGQFSKLEILDLSYNSLEGTLSEAHFISLHNLTYLLLSFNSLTLDLSPGWIPPFHLQEISLASCKTGPSFPTWLQTQRNVVSLDLSSNFISDEVPKWFWNLSSTMSGLNLSHNQMSGIIPDLSSIPLDAIDLSFNMFSGPIPQLPSSTFVVQLNQNKFSGPIPQLPFGIRVVQLSQNEFSGSISFICKLSLKKFANELMLIDLSNNLMEGSLPNCLENMKNLRVLNLNNNNFSGEIPHSLGDLLSLETLHLRGNKLSGELPSTLKNCRYLKLVDIGDNKLSGNIPPWMGENYGYMTHLSLRRNRFHGAIPSEICHLNHMQMLDLSGNDFSGKIPQCFNNFTSLVYKNTTTTSSILISASGRIYIDYALVQWKGQDSEYKNILGLLKLIDLSSNKLVGSIPKAFSSLRGLICLNLSRNSLTGNIDPNIGEMEMLDCLDLSRNHLTGAIPSSFANLHYLGVLDLSYNNLSGKIPTSTQLQSFNESVFAGNYDLCGKPLKLCPEDDPRPSPTSEGEEKDEGFWSLSFMQEFGIAMGFGFVVGFWGLVGSLVLKKSWRWSYFNFLDVVGVWFYETTTVCFTKFKRRS